MKKITILPVIAAFIAIVAFAPQDAHATSWVATGTLGSWDAGSSWLGGIAPPANVPVTDTVTIPASTSIVIPTPAIVHTAGNVFIGGTLIINPGGTFRSDGNLNVALGGEIDNNSILNGLLNQGNLDNFGTIVNNGLFGTRASTINHITGVINNHKSLLISGTFTNDGTVNAYCHSTITTRTNVPIDPLTPNPAIIVECPSIPEFPIPFSMIIIFVAVAAVYMGIRQKMIPGFKI